MNKKIYIKKLFPKIVIFFLISSLFWFVSVKIVSYVDTVDSDFFSFWLAGRVIQKGLNPYNEQVWIEGHYIYDADWVSDKAFLYPLYLGLFMIPISHFDLNTSYGIWVWISQLLIFLSGVYLIISTISHRSHYFLFPIIAGIILFRPLFPLLLSGQIAALLLFILVLSLYLTKKHLDFLGGLTLSLLSIKPNIAIPLLFFISIYLLVTKRYQFLLGIVVGLLSLFLLAWIAQPNWFIDYFYVLVSKQTSTFGYSPSIWGLAFLITGGKIESTITISLLFCFIILVYYVRSILLSKEQDPLQAISLSIAIAVFITPYIWPYDQIILIVPIIFIIANLIKKRYPYLISATFFLLIDLFSLIILLYSQQIQKENLQSLIPLTLIIILFILPSPNVIKSIEQATHTQS
ncbi:MAG: glycosyltransferase 87 family protein [Chloroflexota bacterium]